MKKKKTRILVTGGFGYIGYELCKLLKKKKESFYILDDLTNSTKKVEFIKFFIKSDIKNLSMIKKIIKKNNIDTVIHLAAKIYANESWSKKEIYYKNNYEYPRKLYDLCSTLKVKNFIFSSTAAVYGDKKIKFKENDKKIPINPYGYSKNEFEKYIIKKKYKINYAIIRFFNVVGRYKKNPYRKNLSALEKMKISFMKKKPSYTIFGNDHSTVDGSPARDFIHIIDLVNLIYKSLIFIRKKNKSIIFNCGYGKSFTILKTIKQFSKLFKKNIKIKFAKRIIGDPSEVIADVSELKKLFSYRPKFDSVKKIVSDIYKNR
ncbi:NAD-dependent epimerase/dehydratase family protein [Candidatus Pelagibacter sp.]|nr:NAD-dependent epimerase/dehydratase family protein [Candidatus Pelagibacter sp.]